MGKPVPKYWWKFSKNTDSVIVRNNQDGGEKLAEFFFGKRPAELQIILAEKLISDYEAGRKTPVYNKLCNT